jgi:hypothetical protein
VAALERRIERRCGPEPLRGAWIHRLTTPTGRDAEEEEVVERGGVGSDRTERRFDHHGKARFGAARRDEFATAMQLLITGLQVEVDDPCTRPGVEERLLARTPGHQMDIKRETGCGEGPGESKRTGLPWDEATIGDVEMKAVDAGGDQSIERSMKIWTLELKGRGVESVAGHDATTAGVGCSAGST